MDQDALDWMLTDDFSSGLVFGVESDDVESIYRILDEEPDSMEVKQANTTRADAELRNSPMENGYEVTGLLPYPDTYGTVGSHMVVPSSFNVPGNGGLGPNVTYSNNVVSYAVKCESETVSNVDETMIDSKCTPCSPAMVTPYFNTMRGNVPGIGETQNSSLMSPSSYDSGSIIDGTDICTSSEPYGHYTTEVSRSFVQRETFQFFPNKEGLVNDLETGVSECYSDGASQMVCERNVRQDTGTSEKSSVSDASSGREFSIKCETVPSVSPACVKPYNSFDGYPLNMELEQPYIGPSRLQENNGVHVKVKPELEQPYIGPSRLQENNGVHVKVKPELELENVVYSSVPGMDSICSDVHTDGGMRLQWSGVSHSGVSYQTDVGKEYSFQAPEAAFPGQDIDSRSSYKCVDSDNYLQYVADPDTVTLSPECLDFLIGDKDSEYNQLRNAGFNVSSFSSGTVETLSSGDTPHRDEDSSICTIESKGESVTQHQSLAVQKPVFSSGHFTVSQTFSNCGGLKLESDKGDTILQAALQDIFQPNSEASPPDGVLAVPLLRHQRIALSWMSQKETSGETCLGGILADDQGLGKTISTIALILTERSTHSRPCKEDLKNGGSDQLDESQVVSSDNKFSEDSLCKTKGMPAAGTLIVCPTSLMRQWADELSKKVTREANLSVLVYHGFSRTKDPHELSKYDVVITTYAIVNMEVPKQPLADKVNVEKVGVHDGRGESAGFRSIKKDPPNSQKRGTKRKHGDCEGGVSLPGPLAKVSWFRVVLDEAQSIKNHKTQAARAFCGIHANRRWCLSGTPIQNSIDDLYSYFKFLNFKPYSSYTSFCDIIKNPITRNPVGGYQNLQAVLRTILLRRTKDTLLDGKPIIALPPKSIELRKVDFTNEEREFYSKLECDSRDQFKEYAAAGTVKQNYVNILLMLLRLRQACGHPRLVSSSPSISLIDVAKKLPYEKQTFLRNCLEASLANCVICNGAPEDAVVSICGHVFCKHCICEYLTGDNNQCPLSNCKAGLEISSLFSKKTLDNAMLSLRELDAPRDRTTSDPVATGESCFENLPCGSSKIKAALEILQSLSRPQSTTTVMNDLNQSSQDNEIQHLNKSVPATSVKSSVDSVVKVVGEKAIVFSQWTKMLDLLEAGLTSSCIQYRRFDGKMSVAARDQAIQDFNTLPEVSVMIMSLKAASLGLNMVAACHVLMLDLWWNPTTEDQAIDRAHRIGQTRPVNVVRFTVKDTVEDRILALQQKKRMMVASAFGEAEKGSRQSHLSVDDLNYLFMA